MKSKTVFVCRECGNETPRWQGQCPACGAWNSIVEFEDKKAPARQNAVRGLARSAPKKLRDVTVGNEIRFSTGMGELDRVLGGGGWPGRWCWSAVRRVLASRHCCCRFVRISEKRHRFCMCPAKNRSSRSRRAARLHVDNDELMLLAETDIDAIIGSVDVVKPDILIVDSIQTLYHAENTSSPGSVSQVKECTMLLMQLAKSTGITVFVVGHVNKEGAIAGPKVLEHMVDCVLYF